jgi:hypothetical protein
MDFAGLLFSLEGFQPLSSVFRAQQEASGAGNAGGSRNDAGRNDFYDT